MTYRSRILRTKKRLSDDRWAVVAVIVSLLGLLVCMTFGLRTVSLGLAHGVVPAEMPVVAASPEDPAFHRYKEEARATMGRLTPAVVLTTEAFYFGDLSAFTANFADVHDKFVVRHVDGEPQLQTLIDTMEKWLESRKKSDNVPYEDVLVLVPAGDIPMPIVIQVIAGLRKSPRFERVVLGSGII